MPETEIYLAYNLRIVDSTDLCKPPCHTIMLIVSSSGIALSDLAIGAEAILAYEREVEIAEGREPRRKTQPCRCGAHGATLTPGPLHFTSCTLWTTGG